MRGYDLAEGKYLKENCSEDELWKSFKNVFSSKTRNSSSYKFVFLKAIIDSVHRYGKQEYSFYEIFERFTEIYWILVVKYGLLQDNSDTKGTYVEQILKDYVGRTDNDSIITIPFDDLTVSAKEKIIHMVVKKCKTYVVGSLYGDTNGVIYSFSKKKEIIEMNPIMIEFISKHGDSIEEINYYELTKFIDKKNPYSKAEMISEIKQYRQKNSQDIYRQMLYDEFEKSVTDYGDSTKVNYNTIELLLEANSKYDAISTFERESLYFKKIYEKEKVIENDSENMKLYLDDPERIIKMIKIRRGIVC